MVFFQLGQSHALFIVIALLQLVSFNDGVYVCHEETAGTVSEAKDDNVCPVHAPFDPSTVRAISPSGPWGGSGGEAFYDGTAHAIAAIKIRHGKAIHSVQFQYVIGSTLHWSQSHGSTSEGDLVTINLNYEEEYITQIKGYYGIGLGVVPCPLLTVNSIELRVVNGRTGEVKRVGPFGSELGIAFSSPSKGAKIIGFYGSASTSLHQIGAFVHYASQPSPHCE